MSKSRLLGTALALCFTSAPAFADISATDLWDEWVAISAAQGSELTAQSQEYSGGVLTISGIRQQQTLAEGTSIGRIDKITMTEESDGSVSVTMTPEYLLTISFEVDGEPIVLPITMTLDGLAGRVSGDDLRTYETSVANIEATFSFAEDANSADISVTMSDLAAVHTMTPGTTGPWDFEGSSTATDLTVAFEAQERGADIAKGTFAMEGITSGSSGQYAEGMFDPNARGLGGMGIDFAGQFAYASSVSEMFVNDHGDITQSEGTTGAGILAFAISPDKLAFSGESSDQVANMMMAGLPFPIEYGLGHSEFAFEMPVGVTDGAAPVELKFAARDLVLSDIIWGLFDPTGQLPRDPITIALDLSGMATTFMDLTNFEALEEVQAPPGEINAVTINELTVQAAGAELMGAGDLEMINKGSAFGPGVPQPVGKINLELNGAFALIDKLIAMGYLPPEQGQMARMMSGMVARPVGDDQLVSEFEFTRDGGILANGLPLPF